MNDRALVRNTASPRQVKQAAKLERDRREAELADLKNLLALPEGRRFLWRVLGHCKTFESIWNPNAQIHYAAGMQDVGHYLIAEITAADEGKFLTMMQESLATRKLEQATADGVAAQDEEMNDGSN